MPRLHAHDGPHIHEDADEQEGPEQRPFTWALRIMCICMYISTDVFKYIIYIYILTYMVVYVCIHLIMYICTCYIVICIYIIIYIHTYIYTYIHNMYRARSTAQTCTIYLGYDESFALLPETSQEETGIKGRAVLVTGKDVVEEAMLEWSQYIYVYMYIYLRWLLASIDTPKWKLGVEAEQRPNCRQMQGNVTVGRSSATHCHWRATAYYGMETVRH